MQINDLRNRGAGPCAILGNGESVRDVDLPRVAAQMPVIGVNRSWEALDTPWRCFVDDYEHLADICGGVAPKPELAIFPQPAHAPAPIPGVDTCTVNRLPLHSPADRRFMGFELGIGSWAAFSGLFALEVAAWAGYDPIHLLGFDNTGGYFFHHDAGFKPTEGQFVAWDSMLHQAACVLSAHGVSVINCAPGVSVLEMFPFSNEFARG